MATVHLTAATSYAAGACELTGGVADWLYGKTCVQPVCAAIRTADNMHSVGYGPGTPCLLYIVVHVFACTQRPSYSPG